MITKSGLDTKNFESNGIGTFKSGLEGTYTANVPTKLYVLKNDNGTEACITNFGARIVSLMVQGKENNFYDVELGFDNISDYADFREKNNVFGAVIGRFANRISNGHFEIDGKDYQVENTSHDPDCVLHGGAYNWSYQTFSVVDYKVDKAHTSSYKNMLHLRLISPDGDGGFPGEVTFDVVYILDNDNRLIVNYFAKTTKPTVFNVTNHSYFCLSGDPSKDCLNEEVYINADKYTKLKEGVLPTGDILNVESNSPMDFTRPKKLGRDIYADCYDIKMGNGYDHNFVLNSECRSLDVIAASCYDPTSKIKMDIYTDRPGIQLYDAVDLDSTITGKKNIPYGPNCAVCFETQGFPDAPNYKNFPNCILRPEKPFKSTTIYAFSS